MLDKLKLFIKYDNALMWLLFAMSIVATFFIIERLLKFRSWHIKVDNFKHGILNNLRNKQILSATAICERTPGPIAHLIGKLINNGNKSREDMTNSIEADYLIQIALLEKNLKTIITIAQLAPLIGLLGTTWGLLNIFDILQVSEITNISSIAQYVVTALTTTILGLIIAIPCYGFYNFFVATVENIVQEMEITVAEIIVFLEEQKATP